MKVREEKKTFWNNINRKKTKEKKREKEKN